jgi:indole-3-glycerol phosphate synthase
VSEDFLAGMAASSRARAIAARERLPAPELLARIRDLPQAPALRLHRDRFDLIAEVKLRSPAMGQLKSAADDVLAQRVAEYAAAGAAAVSVLTEPSRFDGSMNDLEQAVAALSAAGVPAMRKDFLVEPYQVLEARAAGAGGVLVILRMLAEGDLAALIDTALEHGLFVLLEAFDAKDIALAHSICNDRRRFAAQLLVGVNCRDLTTLQVVPGRLEQLVDDLPAFVARVAESGVASASDAARVARAGYQLALVGSALMSAHDPRALATDMLAQGRNAAAARALRATP